MKLSCPRLMVAGTGSGVGKTSVTLALVTALRKRGLTVQTFKVGPDYLDPTYLRLASGRPCYNLDGWMAGEEYVRSLFATRAAGADVAVIEGVMGLFDGSDPITPEGSAAEVAGWLDAPILLVVGVWGVARSIAALVKGYTEFDPTIMVAGIIANHCGSERHGFWLSESLSAFGLPPLVAGLPRGAFPDLPSRHLGLVTADSRNLPDSTLSELGDALERFGSVEKILSIARGAPDLDERVTSHFAPRQNWQVRLGLAFDEAFHFYYPDNLEALEAAGCELVRFSPVEDRCLPDKLDGIYLGGGYPEEHARGLSENRNMLESVRSFAQSGRPVYAECGGLMYLSLGIESLDGTRYPLLGLLPTWTRMLERLKSLGYVEVEVAEDSLFGAQGDKFRGHEFHYSELMGNPVNGSGWSTAYRVSRRLAHATASEGFQQGRILASYVHAHFASKPALVDRFVSICAERK